jgi:hypothetical protein
MGHLCPPDVWSLDFLGRGRAETDRTLANRFKRKKRHSTCPLSNSPRLVCQNDLALLTYRIAGNGILTPLPGSSFRTGDGFEPYNAVVADPWGRFVYVSSLEGIQPLDAKLSVYRVGGWPVSMQSSRRYSRPSWNFRFCGDESPPDRLDSPSSQRVSVGFRIRIRALPSGRQEFDDVLCPYW